jgi:hypothetical protein
MEVSIMTMRKHVLAGAALLIAGIVYVGNASADYVAGRGYTYLEDWDTGDWRVIEFDLATGIETSNWVSDRTEDIEGVSFATDWPGFPGDHLFGISADNHMASMDPGGEQQDAGDFSNRLGGDAGLDVYNGTLYNLNGERGAAAADRHTYLYRLDDDSHCTLLGTMDAAYADNIAFAPDGTAYAMDWYYDDALYTVDLGTGELSWVGSLGSVGTGRFAGSGFYNGTLYAMLDDGAFYTVNTTTGAATYVGALRTPGGAPWEHLVGAMAVYVPEPGSLLLFGLAGLWVRRRR